jgi:hypothetical protein
MPNHEFRISGLGGARADPPFASLNPAQPPQPTILKDNRQPSKMWVPIDLTEHLGGSSGLGCLVGPVRQ